VAASQIRLVTAADGSSVESTKDSIRVSTAGQRRLSWEVPRAGRASTRRRRRAQPLSGWPGSRGTPNDDAHPERL